MKITKSATLAKSGLSKSKGLQEIDRLQKEILALQTEKEFVKSSYEGGLAKYWEIDEKIRETQDKVCSLQNEFGAGIVIEDDDARELMASAALKSCQETLAQLEEKQEKSVEEVIVESKRISDAREKLKSLKDEFLQGEINQEMPKAKDKFLKAKDKFLKAVRELKSLDQEPSIVTQERKDLDLLRVKIKEHFEVESNASLSVTELAEKIDELVNSVISLEAAVSSQAALIQRLRAETDELQAQIRILEDDKATLINGKNDLRDRLTELEETLLGLQELNRNVEDRNNGLQTHFTEAHHNLDHITEKLHDVKPDEEIQARPQTKWKSIVEVESQQEVEGQKCALNANDGLHALQKINSEEESEVLGKQHEDVKRQEGALNAKNDLHEPQKLNSEEGQKVSCKPRKELRRQQVALHLDDGPNESQNMELQDELKVPDSLQKEKKLSAKVNSQAELKEPEEKLNTEELNVSESSQKEKEFSTDVNLQAELKGQGQEEKLNPEDLKVSGRTHEESRGQGSALGPNGILDEPQNVKPDGKIEVSLSSQKIKATEEKKEEETKEDDLRNSTRNHREDASLPQTSDEPDDPKEKSHDMNMEEDKQDSPKALGNLLLVETQKGTEQDDEPDWKHLFMNGIGNREKTLLSEYTAILRNYKEIKKRLAEAENKNGDGLYETMVRLKELRSANAKKDEQIKILNQKLSLLQTGLGEDDLSDKSTSTESQRLERQEKQDGNTTAKYSLKSDAKPLYKHLREIHIELAVWLEKSVLLKDDLKSRFSSLCDIQEEISAALKESAEDDDFKFTSYQAAKFQGEILNMKQENNKVADELQAGLDHVTTLQLEVENTLAKLNEEFKLAGSKNHQNIQLERSDSRNRVPLRSFIFGAKPKKQKHSIFSCVHPVLQTKYNGFKAGINV
ncbi:hypothetical protein GH714_016953 [Hevea brasiliensis]|uniref:NAB domain-containing protein n=1 Tax=Hevea brasiliensis TaxID=3981 RepID=A0A6A6K6S6_HEVBR|nr:hypothetical protein GH714_016902 [Hevea brasiliensis]KAF2283893.1 hypothetical protein GH714_016953 [Hevea brasiliensis]